MLRNRRNRRAEADSRPELLRTLHHVSVRLRTHLSVELVVRTSADALRDALDAASVTVWLRGANGALDLAYATPSPPLAGDPTPSPVVKKVAHTGKLRLEHTGARSEIAAPLVAPRSGALGVIAAEATIIGAAEKAFLDELAQEAALAIETANLFEQAVAAKERSEALLAHVADAIVVTDTRGRILHANGAASWLLSVDPRRGSAGSCASSIGLHMGERPLECANGCALLGAGTGAPADGLEVWRVQTDGRRQPLLASVAAVPAPDGNVAEVVHSFRDITRLKQADEAKTLFLATASHELKTPLTVIQGFSQLLATTRLADEGQRDEAARAIERRAAQLTKIVERLLLSSRIEAGRVEVSVREVEPEPLLEEIVAGFRGGTGREVLLDADGAPPVIADPDALRTIVEHLLDNAAKYAPGEQPIRVTTKTGGPTVDISVADRGIGMAPDQAAHCFDKFWQAETTDVRRFGGTGIGLYIVKSLVEAMQGTVTVDTELGAGSTFTVALRRAGPAADAHEDRDANAARIRPEPSVIREFMRQLGIPQQPAR